MIRRQAARATSQQSLQPISNDAAAKHSLCQKERRRCNPPTGVGTDVPFCAGGTGGAVWRGNQGISGGSLRFSLPMSSPIIAGFATFFHNTRCSDWIAPLQQFTSRLSYPLPASVSRHSLRSDSRAPAICVALLSRAAPFGCRMPPWFSRPQYGLSLREENTGPHPEKALLDFASGDHR